MSDNSPRTVVFAGPSLGKSALPVDGNWIMRGPVAQGDVIKTVLEFGPCTIAIIDGFFQRQPAVRHKEILWALSKGARVFGAASMGALRAAELANQGMIGYGLIYRWYRRTMLAPDDAVAVTHAPAELRYRPLSDALVDLRMTFKALQKACILTAIEQKTLTHIAAQLPFPERTIARIVETGRGHGINLTKEIVQSHFVPQKKRDAMGLLTHVSTLSTTGALSRPSSGRPFVITDAFLADAEAAGIPLDTLEVAC